MGMNKYRIVVIEGIISAVPLIEHSTLLEEEDWDNAIYIDHPIHIWKYLKDAELDIASYHTILYYYPMQCEKRLPLISHLSRKLTSVEFKKIFSDVNRYNPLDYIDLFDSKGLIELITSDIINDSNHVKYRDKYIEDSAAGLLFADRFKEYKEMLPSDSVS